MSASVRTAMPIAAPQMRRDMDTETKAETEMDPETEIVTEEAQTSGNDDGSGNGDGGEAAEKAPPLFSFCNVKMKSTTIPSNSVVTKLENGAVKGKDGENGNDASAEGEGTGDAGLSAAGPAVQIVDGEIVLQESSLVVTGKRRSIQEVEAEYQHVVEEDTQLAIVNATYESFRNKKSTQRWTVEDTKQFYSALRQLGTDFSAMESFFQNRNRKQLKKKYASELKKNPTLVEMALNPRHRIMVDLSVFDVTVTKADITRVAKEAAKPVKIDESASKNFGEEASAKNGKNKIKNSDPSAQDQPNEEGLEVVEEDGNEENNYDFFGDETPQENTWSEDPEAIDFPESNGPSMDEFFGGGEMDVGMDADVDERSNTDANVAMNDDMNVDIGEHGPELRPKPESAGDDDSPAISLVPMATGKKKSKRPKFRSAARKRK